MTTIQDIAAKASHLVPIQIVGVILVIAFLIVVVVLALHLLRASR